MGKYFGTDGIRGRANHFPVTAQTALQLAQAIAHIVRDEKAPMRPCVVIGKDTRLSGYMLESALQAGFTSAGFYCLLAGVIPTPAVAQLTRSLRADVGVMISASHNPYTDNGLKFMTADGYKFSQALEEKIELLLDTQAKLPLTDATNIGKAVILEGAAGRYIESCKASLPRGFMLDGLKVVVDCANGATYKIAPKLFWEMGAEVIRIHAEPDGLNINENCGATAPESLQAAVKEYNADLGVAIDGDGDRVILVDEHGEIIDGDQIIAAIALHMQETGLLKGKAVVLTQMNNMGLSQYLNENGIASTRTPVGDRFISQELRKNGLNFGGETCGHIMFLNHSTVSDACLTALQFLYVMRHKNTKASALGHLFKKYPQILRNIPYNAHLNPDTILNSAPVQSALKEASINLEGQGRILLRKSGTEPLIRLMVEATDPARAKSYAERLSQMIEAQIAS